MAGLPRVPSFGEPAHAQRSEAIPCDHTDVPTFVLVEVGNGTLVRCTISLPVRRSPIVVRVRSVALRPPLPFQAIVGALFTFFDSAFGLYNLILSASNDDPAMTGTVMIAVVPLNLGVQMMLQHAYRGRRALLVRPRPVSTQEWTARSKGSPRTRPGRWT
jgi:hypothetical protein